MVEFLIRQVVHEDIQYFSYNIVKETIFITGHEGQERWPWCVWRHPWCNGYRRKKWTRWHEFKSWTRLIAFHKALISLGKVWIQLFSLQLWVNSWTEWVLSALVRQLVWEKENSEFKPVKLRLKIDLVSFPARAEGLVNRMKDKRKDCVAKHLNKIKHHPQLKMFRFFSNEKYFYLD